MVSEMINVCIKVDKLRGEEWWDWVIRTLLCIRKDRSRIAVGKKSLNGKHFYQ